MRKNPFLDTYYTYDSVKRTIFVAIPCLFFITSMVMLRGRYDLEGFCNQSETSHPYKQFQHTVLEVSKSVVEYIGVLFGLNLQTYNESNDCKIYSKSEVFAYNYFVWTAAFFIGLQFTHMD